MRKRLRRCQRVVVLGAVVQCTTTPCAGWWLVCHQGSVCHSSASFWHQLHTSAYGRRPGPVPVPVPVPRRLHNLGSGDLNGERWDEPNTDPDTMPELGKPSSRDEVKG